MSPEHALFSNLWNRCSIDDNGCWVFPWGGKTRYPRNNNYAVHAKMYELSVGKPADGSHIHHACENKRCCNPAHLTALSCQEHRRVHREARTHCIRGHELSGDNIKTDPHPITGKPFYIKCKTCREVKRKERVAKKKTMEVG